jgi:SSS family solute:Na+ symporter
MRMAALLGTALSLPIALACIALGVMGRALFPDFSPADQLYPHLAAQYLGPGLRGLVVAALLAAAISTFDSMGSSLSALFTRDIYARFLARGRIDDRRSLAVSRVATVGILALGFLYLPFVRSKETMLSAFLTLIPVFVTPLFTLYLAGTLTRAHPRSGIIGLVAGSLYGIGAFLEREVFVTQALPGWLTERWFAYPWSMAVTAGAMALATAVLGRAQERGTVATSDGSAGAVRASPFPGERVPVWARPGWIAVLLTALSAYLVFGLLW